MKKFLSIFALIGILFSISLANVQDIKPLNVPTMIFDLQEKKLVDQTDTLFDYEINQLHLNDNKEVVKQLEAIFKDYTQLDVEILQVFVTDDNKFAYVQSYFFKQPDL